MKYFYVCITNPKVRTLEDFEKSRQGKEAFEIAKILKLKTVVDFCTKKSDEQENLKKILTVCKEEHEKLEREILTLLRNFSDEGKDPNPMAKGMSWMKTNVKLVMNESDSTIADLMTDGCNMGVKSLYKYLNQYKAANEVTKDIAKRLINLEERLAIDIRGYL